MNPIVSVIMPVYNAAPFVERAIASVLMQEHEDWELLIIDDGSTDGSKSIIDFFSDSRIHYFFQPNRGVSSARNVGLSHMKGKYLCFLDADDTLPPGSLSKRLLLLEKNAQILMADGHVEVYDATMKFLIRTWKPSTRGNAIDSMLRLRDDCFFSLTWMIRVGPQFDFRFDEEMTHAEDLLFLARIASTGQYDYVEAPVYQYRVSAASAMKDTDGLGKGYWQYYQKVSELYDHNFRHSDRLVLLMKIRKIMFLSYWFDRKIMKAFRYLLTGRTHRIQINDAR